MAAYTLDTVIEAPRDVVYEVFADRERNGDWRPVPIPFRLKVAGTTERQGVGAVHFGGIGRVGVSEQITDLVPGERIVYELIKGLPVKRHIGTITFADDRNGTRVRYTMDSTPKIPIPSSLVALVLRGAITIMVSGARREAAKRAST